MLKLLGTIVRGSLAEAHEAVFDASATRILGQQLREAAAALEHSRKELACAMASKSSEERAADALDTRIGEWETSAVAALAGGREDLAVAAADVIAASEEERRDRREALARFDADVQQLKQSIEQERCRLNALRRGLEMARVQDALHRAGANGRRAVISGAGALREAEAMLARIRERQTRDADRQAALRDLGGDAQGRSLDERLQEAGFAPRRKAAAADVLARLKIKAAAPALVAASAPNLAATPTPASTAPLPAFSLQL